MSLGRKLCLFVCYVKQVGNKQWVVKGIASIQWIGGEACCRMNIRGDQRQSKTCLLFWSICWKLCKMKSLQRLVVVV